MANAETNQGVSRDQDVGAAFLAQARRGLSANLALIQHCIGQLDSSQVWWRPHDSLNSIANIVLHLCGNLRQWIVSGVGGAPDVRDRPREFSERGPIPKAELLRRLVEVAGEVEATLATLADADLLEARTIQGSDETVLSAISQSLGHLGGHTQEIVYITRLQLGDTYKFARNPPTPQPGTPT